MKKQHKNMIKLKNQKNIDTLTIYEYVRYAKTKNLKRNRKQATFSS